jgi:hypothetical protein
MARLTAAQQADLDGAAGISAAEADEELAEGADLTGDGEVDQDDDDAAAIAGAAEEPRPRRRGPGHEDFAADWGEWDIPPAVAAYLKHDETKAIPMRRHIVRLLGPAAAVIGGLVAAIALNSYAYETHRAAHLTVHVIWWAYLIGAAWGIYKYLEWRQTWFVITGHRLMLVETTRLLGRRVRMLPIDKLRDCEFSQTPLGRVWKYATFTFASIGTGGTDRSLSEVQYLPWPEWLYERISELMMPTPTRRVVNRGPK